jgi:hypothetical protein
MDDQDLTKPHTPAAEEQGPEHPLKRGSMQRFRQNNRRIDYYPAERAARAIDALQEINPTYSLRELVDYLVVTGYKAASGKQ